MNSRRLLIVLLFGTSLGLPVGVAAGAEPSPLDEILPLLEENCFRCHGGRDRIKGGLRLTSRAALLEGGDSGPAIDLVTPDRSLLLRMIRYEDDDHQMPPKGKLEAASIDALARWVHAGAPWTDADGAPMPGRDAEADEPSSSLREPPIEPWRYGRLARPAVPLVNDAAWSANPIDAFILAKLEANDLRPAPRADRISLLRRVTFDLTGLPPSPDEAAEFLADESEEAYTKLVERLLASPRYGEHWGRHWLDLVRYAETNGYERDTDKPFIWRYRDYVIDAFNEDKPYDRFILEQLAGDELDDVTRESLIATGYLRLMQWDDEPGQGALQARYDVLDDVVSTTSQVFLGVTIGCARCHDHKKDPIPQADYYRFLSFFHGIDDMRVDGPLTEIATPEERAVHDRAVAEKRAELGALEVQRLALEADFKVQLLARDGIGLAPPAMRDLRYRFYRDTWDELPDFDALRPESTGTLESGMFDLSPATRAESIGFVFEGTLSIPADGEYRFFVDSNDGARLSVAGTVVVDHDGVHRLGDRREGGIALARGDVPVRLDYFNRDGAGALRVWWSREPAAWRYTFDDPGPDWANPEFDDSAWLEGSPGFGTRATPGAEVGTEWSTRDVWMRRTFVWNRAGAARLTFAGHHDDDVAVFVNGTRVLQRDGYVVRYDELAPDGGAVDAAVQGANLIAVRGSQDFGGQYVHVEPVRRDELDWVAAADLAFGRYPLSVDATRVGVLDVLAAIEGDVTGVWPAEKVTRYRELRESIRRVAQREVPLPRAFAVRERGPTVAGLHVHVRGNAHALGEEVEPAFPAILGKDDVPVVPPPGLDASSSGRRRALAEWIAAPDNPMTARVMANRIWQFHFGRGIAKSPSDFGALGEGSTHPELLDWLAAEFVARGFSMKAMHRLVLSSNAYRMSSRSDPVASEVDPENDLFWRFDMRRLSAEEIRDSMIAMTGRQNEKRGGPSFFSRMPHEALATSSRPGDVWGRSPEEETFRRSVYIKVKRSLVTPILARFDAADTDASCPVRFKTTQPTQALTLLNGEFANEMASLFAVRLGRDGGSDVAHRIHRAYALALSRPPSATEVESNERFIAEWDHHSGAAGEGLTAFCLMMLNLNEFVYLD